MNIKDFAKLLRSQWITVCIAILIGVVGAGALTFATTPMYQATARLYVSAAGGASVAEMYQGNRLSQERVLSYTELITGETVAERTIDKLDLDTSVEGFRENVTATAKPDTVLIDVDVLDHSAVRARDIANTMSDEFVAVVRELETPEDGSTPEARVVVEHRASVPSAPTSPNMTLNVLVGLALGTLLGFGLAVVRDLLDNTVKDRQAVEEITGVGLVGGIPLDKERQKQPAISFGSDNSSIAEAFRKLRTNLQFLAVDNPPRVIVIASSLPNEGKSTTAINVALALAEADHDVVLVDGDMRRPMLASYLDLVGTVGFSTVLSGSASLSEALQKTSFPGLTVLTSGVVPPNPSELLGSLAAKRVLNELRAQFDYVVIDSSPLLAVTDAAVLAANSDGVLLITRFGQTKREQLAHAVGNLEDVGATILGAALTMLPDRGRTAYSYTYYGHDQARPPSLDAARPNPAIAPPVEGKRRHQAAT